MRILEMTTRYPNKDAPVQTENVSGSVNASAQSNAKNKKKKKSKGSGKPRGILDPVSTQPETETVIEATKH